MRRKNRAVINIGTASLILVFAVLALVTFALLSLSSASAQRRLAEKMAERTTQYYEAEASASRTLAQLGQVLEEVAAESSRSTFDGNVETAAGEKRFLGIGELENGLICWQVPVSERQELSVQVRPVFPETEGQRVWKLERWQVTDRQEWENRQNMELYH